MRRRRLMALIFSLIPDVSLDTANKFYTIGWAASLFGAAVTFMGVIFLMWGTRVRDHDFENSVAALHFEAGYAEERAGKLEERAAGLEREAGALRLQVEREKMERLKLEASVAPRRLSSENAAKIKSLLSASAPHSVAIVSRMMDPEGSDFANDLNGAIIAGGWHTSRVVNWTDSQKGLFIATVKGTSLSPAASPLMAAMKEIGLTYTSIELSGDELHRASPWFQQSVLYLIVGAKP